MFASAALEPSTCAVDFGPAPGLESPRLSERSTDLASSEYEEEADTMIVKNLPVRCKAVEISAALIDLGFSDEDLVFVNMPARKGLRKDVNRGYCFIKFQSPSLAQKFQEAAQGYHLKSRKSDKGMTVEPARYQGSELASLGETVWFDKESELAEMKINGFVDTFVAGIESKGDPDHSFEPAFVRVSSLPLPTEYKMANMSPAYVPLAAPTGLAPMDPHDIAASYLRLRF